MSEATLQTLAYDLGIEKMVRNMTEAEKAQLRYIQIMRSSTEWQTDMGRTLITPANALRVMRQQFTLLGRAIGKVFIPIIMSAMPYVIAMTQMLSALAEKLADILAKWFGIELVPDIDYSGLGDISAGITDIGNSADKTAEKLNTMLAPFDDLNVVQNQAKNASSGLGGIGGDLGIELPEYDALSKLNEKFAEGVEKVKGKLKELLPILVTIGGYLVAMKLTGLLTDIATAITNMGMLEKGILGIGLITIGLQVTWKGAKGASHGSLKDYVLGEVSALGGVASSAIGGALLGGVPGAVISAFAATVVGVVSSIKELIDLKPTRDEFWYAVGHAYDEFPILGDTIDTLSEKWSNRIDEMRNTLEFFKAAVSGDTLTIKDYILSSEKESLPVVLQNTINFVTDMTSMFYNFVTDVKYYFGIVKEEILSPILSAFESIEQAIDNKNWDDIFKPILTGASNVLSDLKYRFENWSAKIKLPSLYWDNNDVFKTTGVVKKALEFLNLPTSMPKLKVAWYQDGGYPTSGELFFANENGVPEMVGRIGNQTAVANNDQITTSITNALMSALSQYDFGGGKSPTIIYIGNKKVYEGYGDYVADENDRYGTNMIKI